MEIFLERISPDYDNMIIIVVSGEIASDDAARAKVSVGFRTRTKMHRKRQRTTQQQTMMTL